MCQHHDSIDIIPLVQIQGFLQHFLADHLPCAPVSPVTKGKNTDLRRTSKTDLHIETRSSIVHKVRGLQLPGPTPLSSTLPIYNSDVWKLPKPSRSHPSSESSASWADWFLFVSHVTHLSAAECLSPQHGQWWSFYTSGSHFALCLPLWGACRTLEGGCRGVGGGPYRPQRPPVSSTQVWCPTTTLAASIGDPYRHSWWHQSHWRPHGPTTGPSIFSWYDSTNHNLVWHRGKGLHILGVPYQLWHMHYMY